MPLNNIIKKRLEYSPSKFSHTVKSRFKAQGLYNFIRACGWAYKRRGGGDLHPSGLISGIKKMIRNDVIKRI